MLFYGIAIGMCLLSGSYLLFYRSEQAHTKLAILLLLCLAAIISGELWLAVSLTAAQVYIALLPILFFALLPLLYWYHKSLILTQAWHFSRSCYKHLVAVATSSILSLAIMFMPEQEFQAVFFQQHDDLPLSSELTAISFFAMTLLWLALSASYLIKIIGNSRQYHQQLKQAFANHENKRLDWFVVATIWLVLTWLYACLVLVFDDALTNYLINQQGVALLVLALTWGLCIHILQHQPVLINFTDVGTYKHSAVDTERLKRIADKIELAVFDNELYLDSEISAAKLAEELGISTHYLSQAFSQQMNTTFYDYINSARINRAKSYLLETDKTVLDIATRVGFNTRSAFYNAFKKNAGMTPSRFRSKL